MSQLGLGLGLPAMIDELGLFWCCGDCYPQTQGEYSLIWQPPEQRIGVCVHCGRAYEFASAKGRAELAEALAGEGV